MNIDRWIWGYEDFSGYTPITYPDSVSLLNKIGFTDNAYIIQDYEGLNMFGKNAYMVWKEWLESVK